MSNKNRDTILLHSSLYHQVSLLTDEQAGLLFKATLQYGIDKTEPEFEDLALRLVWAGIKAQVEENEKRYEAKCKQYKENIQKRYNKTDTKVNDCSENEQSNTMVNDCIHNDMICNDMICSDMSSNTTFISSDKSSDKKCVCEQNIAHTHAHTEFEIFKKTYGECCPVLAKSQMQQPNERGYASMLRMVAGDKERMWSILIDMNNKKSTTELYNSVTQTFKKFLDNAR